MDVIPSEETMALLRGRYLGDQDEVGTRIAGAQNETSKKEVYCWCAQFQMFNHGIVQLKMIFMLSEKI